MKLQGGSGEHGFSSQLPSSELRDFGEMISSLSKCHPSHGSGPNSLSPSSLLLPKPTSDLWSLLCNHVQKLTTFPSPTTSTRTRPPSPPVRLPSLATPNCCSCPPQPPVWAPPSSQRERSTPKPGHNTLCSKACWGSPTLIEETMLLCKFLSRSGGGGKSVLWKQAKLPQRAGSELGCIGGEDGGN